MAIPQDWMPPDMPDAQKDEIAAKHPDDPEAAAAEAWATWANEIPVGEQGVSRVATGAQSITYDKSPYESAMERARWYASRSKGATALDVGGAYKFGWLRRDRWGITSEAGEGDPAGPNGEPWGTYTIGTADVLLENGSGPLNARSNFRTQEDANKEIVAQLAHKSDVDHVHTDGGTVDLSDYETKADAASHHNTLQQNIDTGLAGKADNDHVHDHDTSNLVTKDEADEAHQKLGEQISAAAPKDHAHSEYESSSNAVAEHKRLDQRITQVGQDKADTGHGHIDYERKVDAQAAHQDLQDNIDDRALKGHTHSEYASSQDLAAYQTKQAAEANFQVVQGQIAGKADGGHTHAPSEHQHDDMATTQYVDGKVAEVNLTNDARWATKSDKTHLHDGADGGPKYELEKDAIQRYERTALELSTKSDKDHDHPGTDHQHDDLATSVELQTETALRKQGDADLQAQINSAVAGGHNHDTQYAAKAHGHGEFALSSHTHPEYEGGGGGGGDVSKTYVDQRDQAIKAEAAAHADSAVTAEGLTRQAADAELEKKITAHKGELDALTGWAETAVDNEEKARVAGDKALQDQIDALEGYDDTALHEKIDALEPYDDTFLDTALKEEIQQRQDGDADLQTKLDEHGHPEFDLILPFDVEKGEFLGMADINSVDVLEYVNGPINMGGDVQGMRVKFPQDNVTVIGLNHDAMSGDRIKWDEEFPVGSYLVIEGGYGIIVMHVEATQRGGTNSRGHTFTGPIVTQYGTFTDGEDLQICHAKVMQKTKLILDDVVVGDSEWESRITALETAEPPEDEPHDHGQYVRNDADTVFQPSTDRLWTKFISRAPRNENGNADTSQAFGFVFDLDEGNTYRNTFEVSTRNGYALRVLGGTGKEIWVGGSLQQRGGDLSNPNPNNFVTRKNLNEAVENLDTSDLLARIEVLEARTALLGPVLDLGTYLLTSTGYQPTGDIEEPGVATVWRKFPGYHNSHPMNEVRFILDDLYLAQRIAEAPLPMRLRLTQEDGKKQTWIIDKVTNSNGVMHLSTDKVSSGEEFTNNRNTAFLLEMLV